MSFRSSGRRFFCTVSCWTLLLLSAPLSCLGFQTIPKLNQHADQRILRPQNPSQPTQQQPTVLRSLPSPSSDASFMASLQSRIQQVSEDRLPLLILDTMLPRQVLTLPNIENETFLQLFHERMSNETPFVAITGLAQLKTGQRVSIKCGVEAEITQLDVPQDGSGRCTVEFTARRRIQLRAETLRHDVYPWTDVQVEYLSSMDDEEDIPQSGKLSLAHAIHQARSLSSLCHDQWLPLARENEKSPGQIDTLLEQLGPMPSATESPTDCALWVGALINPLPALGVAPEIRPYLLTAASARDRVEIAIEGVEASIRYMQAKQQQQQPRTRGWRPPPPPMPPPTKRE